MNRHETNPEYYKGPYAPQWERHARNVVELRKALLDRFPVLKRSIRTGLGADSSELIQVPPHQKGEPDLDVYHKYHLICHIEVSGSASRNVRIPPQPIYIRPDKLDLAKCKEESGFPYFFWMVYWNVTWLVRSRDVQPYRSNLVSKNWYGVNESYCEIPAKVAKPSDYLFDWVNDKLVSALIVTRNYLPNYRTWTRSVPHLHSSKGAEV